MTVLFTDAMRAQDVAIAKSAPQSRSRADWFEAIRKHAEGMRQPGQSIQQAVAAFISKGDGQVLHKAMSQAGGPSYNITKIKDTAPMNYSGDVDDGDGMAEDDIDAPSFSDLVDQHQKKNPKFSRSQSIDSVMATRQGRNSMAVEKRRIGKAAPPQGARRVATFGDRVVVDPQGGTDTWGKFPLRARRTGAAITVFDGDAGDSFAQMVDAHRSQNPGLTSRSAAIDAVMRTPKGAAAYARERSQRLTKSLRL